MPFKTARLRSGIMLLLLFAVVPLAVRGERAELPARRCTGPSNKAGPAPLLGAQIQYRRGLLVAAPRQSVGAQLPASIPQTEGPAIDPELAHKQAKARDIARDQQLKKQAAELLQLAQNLKAQVDRTDRRVLSVSVIEQAKQIEKLAKKIRESMRDGH